MKTLKYWYITRRKEKYDIAHGIVYGHERLSDGMKIRTSYIKNVSICDGTAIIKTKNSIYYCRLEEANFHQFDDSGRFCIHEFDSLRSQYERKLKIPGGGDGALIVLDANAEYNFVGALFQIGDARKEIRGPCVHLGMLQDSVLIEWYDKISGSHINYAYFPGSQMVMFYSWPRRKLKTIIENAGVKELEISIGDKNYAITPGNQITIFPEEISSIDGYEEGEVLR